jgi:hypothetical protein
MARSDERCAVCAEVFPLIKRLLKGGADAEMRAALLGLVATNSHYVREHRERPFAWPPVSTARKAVA